MNKPGEEVPGVVRKQGLMAMEERAAQRSGPEASQKLHMPNFIGLHPPAPSLPPPFPRWYEAG